VEFSRLIVEITHWVTLSNFIPLGGNPNDLDLAWRDVISYQYPQPKTIYTNCIYRKIHKKSKGGVDRVLIKKGDSTESPCSKIVKKG
jgi:hypothetical protein